MSGEFFYRVLSDKTAEIWYAGTETIIEFPDTVDGYVVTQIGNNALFYGDVSFNPYGKTKIIIIPDSVTLINTLGYPDVIIYGYSGSVAEEFAAETGMVFMPLDGEMPVLVCMFDEWLDFDVLPLVENDIIFIPFRVVFGGMRKSYSSVFAEVKWDDETQTASAILYDDWDLPPKAIETVKLTIGSNTAHIDDYTVQLDMPPKLINGRTLIPLSFLAENFSLNVDWNETLRIVAITKGYDNKRYKDWHSNERHRIL